jgi:hypothetical protein
MWVSLDDISIRNHHKYTAYPPMDPHPAPGHVPFPTPSRCGLPLMYFHPNHHTNLQLILIIRWIRILPVHRNKWIHVCCHY